MKTQLLIGTFVLSLVLPSVASAQARMPHKDAGAIGGDVGVFFPKEDALTTGPVFEGFYEYYFSSRDSIRVGAGRVAMRRRKLASTRSRTGTL